MMNNQNSQALAPLISALVVSALLTACGGGSSGSDATQTPTFTIAGSVAGLAQGASVTLQNNGANPQTISANGTAKFDVPVASGTSYAITVKTQPTGQICTVSNGSGNAIAGATVNVSVTCSALTYTISGTVTGLLSGEQVTLNNNAANPTAVTSNGSFTFSTPVAFGGSYSVAVLTEPLAQVCSVTNGSGTGVAANVANVTVSCGSPTETVLYTFTGGTDGLNPVAGLVAGNDGNFYGTSSGGESSNNGAVFKVTPSGTVSIIYSFAGGTDGSQPNAGLLLGSDGNFYGTTTFGGTSGKGTVFKITSAGVETVIYSFADGTDGAEPTSELIAGPDGKFYGTTGYGGSSHAGTVFSITMAGVETVLHTFTGGTDGSQPNAALLLASDGNFYGTTVAGGPLAYGTVFRITPAGVETPLWFFSGGADGRYPTTALVVGNDGNFYGTASSGGTGNNGAVFKITPAGATTTVYSFAGGVDAANPTSALFLGNDGNMYGTTAQGGANGNGTLFKLTPAGVESVLYSFAGGTDGSAPGGSLILGSDGHFYGTTVTGGAADNGTVFKY